uniref:Uncharacterized protein n=1 Tax=Pan troglodytes TaxID=9598 RepID=A0A2I3TV75_PANTR
AAVEAVRHIHLQNFSRSLLETLNGQKLGGHFCDVTVCIHEASLRAHRCGLAIGSPSFQDKLLLGHSEIRVPSVVPVQTVRQLVELLYSGSLVVAQSEALQVLMAASVLRIDSYRRMHADYRTRSSAPASTSAPAPLPTPVPPPLAPEQLRHRLRHLLAAGKQRQPASLQLPAPPTPAKAEGLGAYPSLSAAPDDRGDNDDEETDDETDGEDGEGGGPGESQAPPSFPDCAAGFLTAAADSACEEFHAPTGLSDYSDFLLGSGAAEDVFPDSYVTAWHDKDGAVPEGCPTETPVQPDCILAGPRPPGVKTPGPPVALFPFHLSAPEPPAPPPPAPSGPAPAPPPAFYPTLQPEAAPGTQPWEAPAPSAAPTTAPSGTTARTPGAEPLAYVCGHCCKTFSSRKNYTKHMFIHSGEKPHQCAHMVTHTCVHAFQCAVYAKPFTQKSSLNMHMRAHRPERAPFPRLPQGLLSLGAAGGYQLQSHPAPVWDLCAYHPVLGEGGH